MSIAFVQSNSRNNGLASSGVLAFAGNVTAGNFIYVTVQQAAIGTTCVITDSLGNTYTEIDHADAGSNSLWHFYAKNITGGACTITVTLGSSVTSRWAQAEYSGVDVSSPIDVFAQNTGTSASPSVSMTTTFPNPLLLNCLRWSAGNTLTAGTNYTVRETQNGASPFFGYQDFISSDLAGSETATATIGASVTWQSLLVAVKPAQAQTPIALVPNTRYRIHEFIYTC